MAYRQVLRQRSTIFAAATVTAGATFLHPRNAFAEEPYSKKPIYDDAPPANLTSSEPLAQLTPTRSAKPESLPLQGASQDPSPTDRLAAQIRIARLRAYDWSVSAEDSFNDLMSRAFKLENDFTSTIASLAPPPQANEPLLPGTAYVLVSALAGSIITRNRGIILRASVPIAFGVTAAYWTIPYTMRNVENLAWHYEEKYPQVAKAHLEARERIERFWETGKAHSAMTMQRGEELIGEGRKTIEDWVSKGK